MGEVHLTLLRRLSDEAAGRQFPCRSVEAEHGDRPATAIVVGLVHVGADQGLVRNCGRRWATSGPTAITTWHSRKISNGSSSWLMIPLW